MENVLKYKIQNLKYKKNMFSKLCFCFFSIYLTTFFFLNYLLPLVYMLTHNYFQYWAAEQRNRTFWQHWSCCLQQRSCCLQHLSCCFTASIVLLFFRSCCFIFSFNLTARACSTQHVSIVPYGTKWLSKS